MLVPICWNKLFTTSNKISRKSGLLPVTKLLQQGAAILQVASLQVASLKLNILLNKYKFLLVFSTKTYSFKEQSRFLFNIN